MVIINKNSNNYMALTLTEKVTINNPTFLFRFTNDLTREAVCFISANLSNYTDRYDRFLVTETSSSLNASSGVIELKPTGSWKYEVFEQASTSNLNPALSGALLESGKVKVIGTDTTHATYSTPTRKYKGYGTGA